ncbi:hypothetical protein ABIC45_005413 [Mucilaginibacter rubeus]|nr:hypothetical protein SAMN03159284_05235 [Mucilaginibacter sp. NFR10]
MGGGAVDGAAAGVCSSREEKHTPPPLSRGESHKAFAFSDGLVILSKPDYL